MNELDEKLLQINCNIACLLKDRAGMLNQYDKVSINCATLIASEEVNATLAQKDASVNASNTYICDVQGDIIEIASGTALDGNANYENRFLVSNGDLILRETGAEALEKATGMVVPGTLYSPASLPASALAKVRGTKKSYPAGMCPLIGSFALESLIKRIPSDQTKVWVSGKVSALDEKVMLEAEKTGLKIACSSLFTYEGLDSRFGGMFDTESKTLVPDGFEIIKISSLSPEIVALYGTKLYIQGDVTLEESNASCLDELEEVIIKGCASLPASLAAPFRRIGKADSYFIYEGYLRKINGSEQITHEELQQAVASSIKFTLDINGHLSFSDDVTTDDIEAISAIYINGAVIVPAAAKAALSTRVKKCNGYLGSSSKTVEQLTQKIMAGDFSNINTNTYFLV